MNSDSVSRFDRVMTQEQFTQVVEAILAGKYSWACVLILRFAGYNPLHYIPYRTYNRLEKENQPRKKNQRTPTESHSLQSHPPASEPLSIQDRLTQIEDLNYLETLHERANLRGGNGWVGGDRVRAMVSRLRWK